MTINSTSGKHLRPWVTSATQRFFCAIRPLTSSALTLDNVAWTKTRPVTGKPAVAKARPWGLHRDANHRTSGWKSCVRRHASGFGITVVLDAASRVQTHFGHLSALRQYGETVKRTAPSVKWGARETDAPSLRSSPLGHTARSRTIYVKLSAADSCRHSADQIEKRVDSERALQTSRNRARHTALLTWWFFG